MYSELLVFSDTLKDQVVNGPQARVILAKACEHFPIDTRVFARDAQGKPLQAIFAPEADGRALPKPPLIHFGGGKGYVRLVGTGAEGVALLKSQAALIGTALGEHFGAPISFKLNDGHCRIEPLHGFVRTYFIPHLGITKKEGEMKKIAARDERVTLDAVTPWIKKLIVDGLISQARFLDDSYREIGNPDRAVLESAVGTDDMLDIQVFEGNPHFKQVHQGMKGKVLCVSGIAFTMAADLEGPWTCGVLRSRGWGSIRKAI